MAFPGVDLNLGKVLKVEVKGTLACSGYISIKIMLKINRERVVKFLN